MGVVALVLTALLAACGGGADKSASSASPAKTTKVGFIYAGAINDGGWHESLYQGELAVAKLANVETIHVENVPENPAAAAVMETMIQQGATIIFATSGGYPTPEVAQKHPNVTFFGAGGRIGPNIGAFNATRAFWQAEYLLGIAAGSATKSDRLGFIMGFPGAHPLLNLNAFHLGARSVNPNVTTAFVTIGSWCDPAKNVAAVQSLVSRGIDVVNLRVDCPVSAIQTAEAAGVMSIGSNFDDSKFAANGWLTGYVLVWSNAFPDFVRQVIAGDYKPALHSYSIKDSVTDLAPFGPRVTKDTQAKILQVKEGMIRGELFPFTGPIKDQSGAVRIGQSEKLDVDLFESQPIDWLAEGIIGMLPRRP